MLTLGQNGGNHVSKDLKFKNFPGQDDIKSPVLKTWIRARKT